jgi:hypothetical protein
VWNERWTTVNKQTKKKLRPMANGFPSWYVRRDWKIVDKETRRVEKEA